MVTTINMMEKKKMATILTLMDIVKCFDQCRLSDIEYELTKAGIAGRDLRMFDKLNEGTVIRIQGDVDTERSAVITNSVGQGTSGAVDGSALMMGKVVEEAFEKCEHELQLGGVTVKPAAFVDDVATARGSAEGAREAGERLTEVLTNLTLRAHPEKTVNLVIGTKRQREVVQKQLSENPMIIQGFEVQEKDEDQYLGMNFSNKGVRESITRTLDKRGGKAVGKTKLAKAVLKDERIQAIGWLDAARVLYQGTITPTLTYSSIAWVRMNKTQRKMLESYQKDCIYDLLDLLPGASYAAVLLELGLPKINAFVDQLKICYVSKLMFDKPNSQVANLLKAEENESPGAGLLGEVKELCIKYKLEDVSEIFVDPDRIKRRVTEDAMFKLLLEAKRSSKVPLRTVRVKARKSYFGLPKIEARAIFLHNVGELNVKMNRKGLALTRYGDLTCPVPGCRMPDTQSHLTRCAGYWTRVTREISSDEELGHHLVSLHRERVYRWKMPLFNC